MVLNSKLPFILKELRNQRGMSQAELAQLLGVSAGAICNWEKGTNRPSKKRVPGFASKLKVPVELFLAELDDPSLAYGAVQHTVGKPDAKTLLGWAERLGRVLEDDPSMGKLVLCLIDEAENHIHARNSFPLPVAKEAASPKKRAPRTIRPVISASAGLSVNKRFNKQP